MNRWFGVALVIAVFSLNLVPWPVRAHAHLDHAVPAINSTHAEPPREIRIWFTQKLEPAFSRIEVVDETGQRVDQGDAKVDTADPAILSIALKTLAPGTYKVSWQVVSVDTHASQGDFSFSVRPQGAA